MTSPHTGNREFRDDVVRVAALTVTDQTISGYVFVNCRIVGPAVLALIEDVEINHCTFEAEINALFWEVDPETRPTVFGAVGVSDTKFVSCVFQGIGFAGPRALRAAMEESAI